MLASYLETTIMTQSRVLGADDNELIRDLIVEALRDAGFEVDDAANAKDAPALQDADGYQLLVTDIHMPGGMDDMELAEKIRGHKPPVPVVFVTGRPDVLGRLKGTGIRGTILPKPFTLVTLTKTVEQLIGVSQQQVS